MTNTPFALTIPEAVEYTRIGRSSLYAALRTKELVARKAGRRTVILRQDLETWLLSRPVAYTAAA